MVYNDPVIGLTYDTYRTIGTCSLCAGPVVVPSICWGPPPLPTCQKCGAVKADSYGPVIPMVKR